MIKITHATINGTTAANALYKLTRLSTQQLDRVSASRFAKAFEKIRREMEWGTNQAAEIGRKYSILDGRGYPVPKTVNGQQGWDFKTHADEVAHDKEFEEVILRKEIEIPVDMIHVSKIPRGVLSGQEMLSLEWILEGVNDEETLAKLDEEDAAAEQVRMENAIKQQAAQQQKETPKLWVPRPV